jgi:DNA repair exonuclease SbcCD ATPase subunit
MAITDTLRDWSKSIFSDQSQEQPANPFTRQATLPFDKKYPRIDNPIRLNEHQLSDIKPRITVVSYTQNELELALSRTPANIEASQLYGLVSAIVYAWQDEHPSDSDAAAKRELLRGSSALSVVDARLEAARLAQEVAEKEQAELERTYHDYRSIPAKHEQLTNKVANLQAERLRLTSTDWDSKIRQLLEAEYNPKPGMIIHENIPSLLMQRDTLTLRLQVIDALLEQYKSALGRLTEDNTKLSDQLGIRSHKLS